MSKKNGSKNAKLVVNSEETAEVRAGSAGAVTTSFDWGTYFGSVATGGSWNPFNSGYQKTNGY